MLARCCCGRMSQLPLLVPVLALLQKALRTCSRAMIPAAATRESVSVDLPARKPEVVRA